MQCKISSPSVFVLLLQLSAMLHICTGIPESADLRCQCINTVRVLKPIDKKQVMKLELFNSGPHCSRAEVILTLKNGYKSCLNPEVKWVKRMVDNILKKKGIKKKVMLQHQSSDTLH
ncbi:growth-regulated alpha protein-like [Bufo bufo]|uniref:growth-regulated alpha protein-like n=1 Tax=Bufo bufo TaxID=8384 RepID=UPI001ABE3765|nr:growth-regulated alpha protein-like [Bufo bufo]